ncbi:MAG: twin-arginine translocase subunit TatC [Planctomycetes bacterium]|nr:twin-arginine translocase subunit TatC [Planctomycetota bacterium]
MAESTGPQGFFQRRDPEGRMTFMQHLLELRSRLFVVAATLFVTMMASIALYGPIFRFLEQPIDNVNAQFREDPDLCRMIIELRMEPNVKQALDKADLQSDLRSKVLDTFRDPKLWVDIPAGAVDAELLAKLNASRIDLATPVVTKISTDPLSTTLILMSVAFWFGIVISSPILLYEIWAFVAPGLKPKERAAIRPVLFGGVFFFFMGAAACYYIIFPLSMSFFVWLDLDMGFLPSYTPDSYINLLITFMLITGAIFEIPMVVAVLAKLGIVSSKMLTQYWRMIVLVCFILGAIISPGNDIISMLAMSGALLFLYVVSVILAWLCYKKNA